MRCCSVSGEDEYRTCADGMTGLNVTLLVPYHDAPREVEMQLLRRLQKKPRPRLSPIALDEICAFAFGGVMRAKVKPVDMRAFFFELRRYRLVNNLNLLIRVISARDAGLIRNDDDRYCPLVQLAYRPCDMGNVAQMPRVGYVADLLVDDAVAIKKHCRNSGFLRHDWHPRIRTTSDRRVRGLLVCAPFPSTGRPRPRRHSERGPCRSRR